MPFFYLQMPQIFVTGYNEDGGVELPDDLDYTDDEHLEEKEIEVNVDEMEEITEETENAPLPMEVQGDGDLEGVIQALDNIDNNGNNGTFSSKVVFSSILTATGYNIRIWNATSQNQS